MKEWRGAFGFSIDERVGTAEVGVLGTRELREPFGELGTMELRELPEEPLVWKERGRVPLWL